MRLSGISSDSQLQILDEDLSHFVLEGICKALFVKDVLPLDMPLRHIKTFQEFCRICILPFI
jgi:hypothetical protein